MAAARSILLIIVAIVAIAQAIGLALGLLTSPRIDILQNSLFEFITQMGLYSRRVAASPEFAQQFRQTYEAAWQALRLAGGYPSWSGTVAAASAAVVGAFLNWLAFGVLAHWTARWFRGQASLSQFLGPLALAYAPLLLTVVLLVPGAVVAMPLVFLALLVAKYQAVKATYGLEFLLGGLAVTLIPYLLVTSVHGGARHLWRGLRRSTNPVYLDPSSAACSSSACSSGSARSTVCTRQSHKNLYGRTIVKSAFRIYSDILQLRTEAFLALKCARGGMRYAAVMFFVVTLIAGAGLWIGLPAVLQKPLIVERIDQVSALVNRFDREVVPSVNESLESVSQENINAAIDELLAEGGEITSDALSDVRQSGRNDGRPVRRRALCTGLKSG